MRQPIAAAGSRPDEIRRAPGRRGRAPSSLYRKDPSETSIEGYLRAVAPLGRDVQQVGPFLATFSKDDDNPYLNYAIPADGAEPTAADVQALVTAYARRHRRARLEYVSDLAPGVEGSLLTAGFRQEGRLLLMVFAGNEAIDVALPPSVDLVQPVTDDDLYAMACVQAEAYGYRQPDRGGRRGP